MSKRLAKRFPCAIEFALAVLVGKWKTTILCCLSQRACRYADLHNLFPRLSDKVLCERLRTLTEAGLVCRERLSPSIHVYALSSKGQSLIELLTHLSEWGAQNAKAFGVQIDSCPIKVIAMQTALGWQPASSLIPALPTGSNLPSEPHSECAS